MTTNETNDKLRSLLSHAEMDGDVQTAGICRRALAGDESAMDQAMDRLVAHEEDANYVQCECCGWEVEDDEVPSKHDDAAWVSIAKHHAANCDWVVTRAHRVFVRVTTRAGRKIRHVAPGHVVDVATNTILRAAPGNPDAAEDGWWCMDYRGVYVGLPLDRLLSHLARAEAVCTMVRYLVMSWQEAA